MNAPQWGDLPRALRDRVEAALTDQEFEALLYSVFGGYGIRRIAAVTGCSHATAQRRVASAKQKAGRVLSDGGTTLRAAGSESAAC